MIYDITPVVSEHLTVWPGDTPVKRHVLLDLKRGDHLTLSSISATVHLGAHADAPSHYGADARAIDEMSLDYYLGTCQVIRVPASRGDSIRPERLAERVFASRVLLSTGTFPNPDSFNRDFAALTPELIVRLHAGGVKLVGVDTPSVDLFESKDLPVHRTCLKHDMAILEGLVLADVPPGLYELIALPLRMEGFDASPVRAILRTIAGAPE
jgi:arylformamidase